MSCVIRPNSLTCRPRPGRVFCITAWRVLFIAMLAVTAPAEAFEELTVAQNLIYDTAHLSTTVAGQEIKYRYYSQTATDESIEDRVLLSINKAHSDDKRDVVVDFLSAERHMSFPDFTAFRGNPVIIAMLEHIAQGFGRETGGGALYFRNRIRDSLAEKGIAVETIAANYGDKTVDATQVVFKPFVDDVYLAEKPEYTGAVFSIVLSEKVPGAVVSIAVKSSQDGVIYFERGIIIE